MHVIGRISSWKNDDWIYELMGETFFLKKKIKCSLCEWGQLTRERRRGGQIVPDCEKQSPDQSKSIKGWQTGKSELRWDGKYNNFPSRSRKELFKKAAWERARQRKAFLLNQLNGQGPAGVEAISLKCVSWWCGAEKWKGWRNCQQLVGGNAVLTSKIHT